MTDRPLTDEEIEEWGDAFTREVPPRTDPHFLYLPRDIGVRLTADLKRARQALREIIDRAEYPHFLSADNFRTWVLEIAKKGLGE